MNKRRQRTEALRNATARHRLAEQADNAIEQHNFDRLVRQGVIRPVQLPGRVLLLGTDKGIEPPLSVSVQACVEAKDPKTTVLANIMFEALRQKACLISRGGVGERVGVGELKVLPNP